MSNIIIESYTNGQKKQAIQQFKNLSEDDQLNFLVEYHGRQKRSFIMQINGNFGKRIE